ENRHALLAQDEVSVHRAARAESRALRTRTIRRVERELPWLELGERQSAFRARIALREQAGPRATALADNFHHAIRRLERRFDRVGKSSAISRSHYQPVHHDGDLMVLAAVELRHVGEIIRLAVDSHAHEALLAHGLELVPELALATAHQRREHFDLGAFRPLEHEAGARRRGLPLDRRSIVGATRRTGAGRAAGPAAVDPR